MQIFNADFYLVQFLNTNLFNIQLVDFFNICLVRHLNTKLFLIKELLKLVSEVVILFKPLMEYLLNNLVELVELYHLEIFIITFNSFSVCFQIPEHLLNIHLLIRIQTSFYVIVFKILLHFHELRLTGF